MTSSRSSEELTAAIVSVSKRRWRADSSTLRLRPSAQSRRLAASCRCMTGCLSSTSLAAFSLVSALVVFWTIGTSPATSTGSASRSAISALPCPRTCSWASGRSARSSSVSGWRSSVTSTRSGTGGSRSRLCSKRIATELGRRGGNAFGEAAKAAGRLSSEDAARSRASSCGRCSSGPPRDHAPGAVFLGVLLILIDMIYKPGA